MYSSDNLKSNNILIAKLIAAVLDIDWWKLIDK